MRASQMIPGEADHNCLLGSVMRILLESAGAQKGYLLLERDGRLLVEAEGTVAGETRVLQGIEAGGRPDLPSAILHQVARPGEPLILPDCSDDARFSDDPYVRAHKPLSVLCMPVLHQGKRMGLLYLENNLVRSAFTRDDVEQIGILAHLIAISFTYARLYEEMRQEVAEHKQVEESLEETHDWLQRRIAEHTAQLARVDDRLENELREREEAETTLREAKEAAGATSRAKTAFLTSMSHELRTPLNAILGFVQILRRRQDLDEAARSAVGIIERSGDHLLARINDILSRSKIEADKGSLLPFEPPLDQLAGTSVAPPERTIAGYRGPVRKILIADDKADNRALLVGLLAPLGFELTEAAEGCAALDMALAWRPDGVLLDLVMPVMDGFEAARRMRATPDLADMVIIALSASVFEEDRKQSVDAGCHDFLTKPVNAGLLFEKLREHLSLEWTYADESSPVDTFGDKAGAGNAADAQVEHIRCPPAARLRLLQIFAETGDVRAIERELDAIEDPDGTYLAFLRCMREMTAEYDMERIADFLRDCLNTAQEDAEPKA